ncbi:MAG: DUF177 domain-containing protein [Chloroflexi bacterium]|nr:DUF177 domain-containing protein [Chloroflexota bacterium]
MQINVAQLLKEPTGASRTVDVDGALALDQGDLSPVQGRAELLRVSKGILVRGEFTTACHLVCSRCLKPFPQTLQFRTEEEFSPSIDVASGEDLPAPEDASGFRIDDHHVLDLTELVRQHSLLAAPMKPLCRPDCAGLCPRCGANLNQQPCCCSDDAVTPFAAAFDKLKSARKSR